MSGRGRLQVREKAITLAGGSPNDGQSGFPLVFLSAQRTWRVPTDTDCVPPDQTITTPAFRLRPTMKQGTAASIPETWTHYASLEDARAGAKVMYHDDRILRVMVVTDSAGSFVEWIER